MHGRRAVAAARSLSAGWQDDAGVGLELPLPGGERVDATMLPSYSQTSITDFHTSTLSLTALERQTRPGNDLVQELYKFDQTTQKRVVSLQIPKHESFDALVRDQLAKLKDILRQLPGESLETLGELRFPPGGVLGALRELIEQKMEQLACRNESQGGSGEVCEKFVEGICTLGATCQSSHTDAALRRWVAEWVPPRMHNGDSLCIAEPLGREALAYVYQHIESTAVAHCLRAHALERHSAKVVWKKLGSNAAPTLSVIDLSHTGVPGTSPLGHLYPEGAAKLASALRSNNTVEQLILDGNELGAKGFLTVLTAFDQPKGNNTLRVLSVKDNNIAGEEEERLPCIEAAGEILRRAKSLESLSLASNPLGPKGAEGLAPMIKDNPRICILDLCATGLEDAGAKVIAEALEQAAPGLLSLNLAWCRIGVDGLNRVFEALAATPATGAAVSIEELSLYCNALRGPTARGGGSEGDQLLKLLKQNSTITSLDLRWTFPTDECIIGVEESLKMNSSLRCLNVEHNRPPTDTTRGDRDPLSLIQHKMRTRSAAHHPPSRVSKKRAELAAYAERAQQRILRQQQKEAEKNAVPAPAPEPTETTEASGDEAAVGS